MTPFTALKNFSPFHFISLYIYLFIYFFFFTFPINLRQSVNSLGQPEIQFVAQWCHFVYVVVTVQVLYQLCVFHCANA